VCVLVCVAVCDRQVEIDIYEQRYVKGKDIYKGKDICIVSLPLTCLCLYVSISTCLSHTATHTTHTATPVTGHYASLPLKCLSVHIYPSLAVYHTLQHTLPHTLQHTPPHTLQHTLWPYFRHIVSDIQAMRHVIYDDK